MLDRRMVIPSRDLELQLKIIFCSHCGSEGHRVIEATHSIIAEKFYWPTLKSEVEKLMKCCLHCMISRAGSLIPRPLSHAIHGTKENLYILNFCIWVQEQTT